VDDLRPPEVDAPQRRAKTRWNYKRIGVALAALIILISTVAYGGYSLAYKFINGAKKEKSAQENVKVAAKVSKPPSTTTTTEPKYIKYVVEKGDSYYAIALKYGTTVEEIKKLNGVEESNNNLQIGMSLKVPAKETAETSVEKPVDKPQDEDEEEKTLKNKSQIEVSSKEISRGPSDNKKVALTFNAGASSEATPRILKALKDTGVKGTFFLTGKWIEDNPELTKKIAEQGHEIGNFTHTHPDLIKATNNEIVYQLNKMEEILGKTASVSSKPLFRAPYGARDARVLRVASNAGYRSIYWTNDSLDHRSTMKPEQVKNRVLAALNNGSIILMHCGSNQTAEILQELIEEIESRGYEIGTVSELFD